MKIFLKKKSSFFPGKSLYNFFQNHTFETIFQKATVVVWFWKKFRRPPTYPKLFPRKSLYNYFLNHTFETIFQKVTVVVWFWKNFRRPPTCPKFNTHKKVVVHFFIPMLLLPKTPSLTYLNMKRFKGPKKHHFTSLHFTHFTHFTFTHNKFERDFS